MSVKVFIFILKMKDQILIEQFCFSRRLFNKKSWREISSKFGNISKQSSSPSSTSQLWSEDVTNENVDFRKKREKHHLQSTQTSRHRLGSKLQLGKFYWRLHRRSNNGFDRHTTRDRVCSSGWPSPSSKLNIFFFFWIFIYMKYQLQSAICFRSFSYLKI